MIPRRMLPVVSGNSLAPVSGAFLYLRHAFMQLVRCVLCVVSPACYQWIPLKRREKAACSRRIFFGELSLSPRAAEESENSL